MLTASRASAKTADSADSRVAIISLRIYFQPIIKNV
jgi:hypothetical protein